MVSMERVGASLLCLVVALILARDDMASRSLAWHVSPYVIRLHFITRHIRLVHLCFLFPRNKQFPDFGLSLALT